MHSHNGSLHLIPQINNTEVDPVKIMSQLDY